MTPVLVALALTAAQAGRTDPAETALANVIATALPDDRYNWAMHWETFGTRLNAAVRWHLSGPAQEVSPGLPDGTHRRVGWISEGGASADVAVCGDEARVQTLAISVSDHRIVSSDLTRPLATFGVVATELSRTEAVLPDEGRVDDHYRSLIVRVPAQQVWRLEKPGHGGAILSADHRCTRPGTRSATRCWTRFTLSFDPTDDGPTRCGLPGPAGSWQ